MAKEQNVLVPDIGDFDEVEVIEVLVSVGDRVEAETSLVTLESDKASMEIPCPYSGTVREIVVKVGDKVGEGGLLLRMEVDEGADTQQSETTASSEATSGPESTAGPEKTTDEASSAKEAAPVPEPAATQRQAVVVPDIGEFEGVEVIEVLVSAGDRVDIESSLVTLESDKASMEIPSPFAGVVEQLAVKVGDRVKEGDLLLHLQVEEAPARDSTSADTAQLPEVAAEETEAVQAPAPMPGSDAARIAGEKAAQRQPVSVRPSDLGNKLPHASPSVRRFARELGADLTQIAGSGPKGRIIKEDVQEHVKRALRGGTAAAAQGAALRLPGIPEVDFSRFGEVEEKPLSRIKKLSGAHLSACWLNIPHVTQHDEADITELEAFRQAQKATAAARDVRLTFLPFLMKACVAVLRELPEFNSSLNGDASGLIYKHYYHIGVAVDTPNGLVVPVVRDVDKKGVIALAAELMEVSARARDGKLLPADMQGGCFSISSLGGIGGTAFTPIVNAPEVAILGVSRSSTRPVWDGTQFLPRLMLPLSLSYDHRVIDGAMAARFTAALTGYLRDIRQLLL